MNWVRLAAILGAYLVHAALAVGFISFGLRQETLQSASGTDDLSVVSTVSVETEESLGLNSVNAERQEASAAAAAAPELKKEEDKPEEPKPEAVKPDEPKPEEVKPEVKREDAIEMPQPPPPDEMAPPQAPIQPKLAEEKPEKQEEPPKPVEKQEMQPTAPSIAAAAQEEQRALNRALEARRSELFSLYNAAIYKAIASHAIRPKHVAKGQVGVELTLSPDGRLLARRVVKSSGVSVLDDTAVANLEQVPFPVPPDGLMKEPYTVTLSFDYSVK